MKINTKFFGEVEIADDKIITFDKGIIGFPELKHFTMLHDEEKGSNVGIRYLQSLEEPGFAMPVMDPLLVNPQYDPEVDDELLTSVGNLTPENILVMVTVTVPADLTKMTVNLQGPFVINVEERKACQIILEGDKYPVKYPVYDILKSGISSSVSYSCASFFEISALHLNFGSNLSTAPFSIHFLITVYARGIGYI